jgi:hypothetical protein
LKKLQKNQSRRLRKVWGLLVTFLIFFLSPFTINAQDEGLNFYVTPEFPDNQAEGNARYFNLTSPPGSTELLTLKLQNAGENTQKIRITAHTAYTNVMGVVEYGKDAEQPDPTLPFSVADLIEVPDIIELASNETKTIEIPLQMPETAFEGFLAGGLRVSEVKEEAEETTNDGEGVAVKNEFAYIIGVVLSNEGASVTPDLELLDVFADQLNYRNVISATLQNFMPAFTNRLEVEATVKRVGSDEILYEASQEQMQMAPNSNFNFPISLEGDRFRSGNYELNLKARSGEESWEWTQQFTIDADEARALNRTDVTIDTSINWWQIGAMIVILLLILVIIYLIWKRKRENKQTEEKHNEN